MSKQQPLDQILASWDEYDRPKDGDIYRHYKGGRYQVLATGFIENSERPCVIYRSFKNDTVWVRTAENFLEKVKLDGKSISRFTKEA